MSKSSVKIKDVGIYPVYLPFRQAFESTWNSRGGVLSFVIEMTDEEGNHGYGDCLCKQSFRAGLEILNWAAGLLKGRSVYQIEEFKLHFEGLGRWTCKHDLSFVGHPLLAGLEMAMWDLIGKRHGRPVYDFLGGRLNSELALTFQIPTKPLAKLEEMAEYARKKGFKFVFLKLAKMNQNIQEDVESVKKVREIMGDDVQISIDVNGAWSLPTAVRALRRMECYDIAYAESPVIGVENLAILRKRTSVPIAADEESCSYRKLMQLIRQDAVDVVVLDLPSFGGISGFKKAADLLEAANIPAVIHGNGELLSPFAAFQVALASPVFKILGHQFYNEINDSFISAYTQGEPLVKFIPSDKPGLGVSVDRVKLAALCKKSGSFDKEVDIKLRPDSKVPSFPKY